MKWLTCTPVSFEGNKGFFERDSGLLCRGFQSIGVDCRAVMPFPVRHDDESDLIRVPYDALLSPDWWSSQGAGAVVLYAWGAPKYTSIAKAIKEAGLILVENMDTSGLVSVYTQPAAFIAATLKKMFFSYGPFIGIPRFFVSIFISLIPKLQTLPRFEHLTHVDVIAAVSPVSLRLFRDYFNFFLRPDLVKKLSYFPHPQSFIYTYDGTPKENIVLSVGRWELSDYPQKNPKAMLKALKIFLEERLDYKAIIVGKGASKLECISEDFPKSVSSRIYFYEFINPDTLKTYYLRSRIGFWASRSEGQQGTGAQMLCCGGSVVSGSGPSLSCFHHYVTKSSGRTAFSLRPSDLANALALEAQSWDQGERNPHAISSTWTKEFHAKEVAQRIVDLVTHLSNSKK